MVIRLAARTLVSKHFSMKAHVEPKSLENHEYEEKRRRLPAERAPSLAALAPAHAPTKSAKIAVDSNAPIMSFSNAP